MQTLQSELKLQVSYVGLLSEAPNRQYVTQATWYRFNLAKSEINPMASWGLHMEVMATMTKMEDLWTTISWSWFLLQHLDVGSEFYVEDMKSWTHPAVCQWFRLLEVLWWGDMSSAPFRTPSARWARLDNVEIFSDYFLKSTAASLDCGGTEGLHHTCGAHKSAAAVWCCHVNMNQNLWAAPWWVSATNSSSSES